jgi:hypothetical protein
MPRQLRIEKEGAIYHLLSSGDLKEADHWRKTNERQTWKNAQNYG